MYIDIQYDGTLTFPLDGFQFTGSNMLGDLSYSVLVSAMTTWLEFALFQFIFLKKDVAVTTDQAKTPLPTPTVINMKQIPPISGKQEYL